MKGGTMWTVAIAAAFVLAALFLVPGASAVRSTTTAITSPASGSVFDLGTAFTVTGQIGCMGGGTCRNVNSTVSFSPSAGLYLPNSDPKHSLGGIMSGYLKQTSWSVNSNSVGNYAIQVSTTSSNSAGSSNSISVRIKNPASCSDSDGGFVPTVQGTASGYDGNGSQYSNTDNCVDSATLTEWYCMGVGGKTPSSSNYACSNLNTGGNGTNSTSYVCVSGACVPQ